MTTHLHHYKDGICADPRAPGGPCGERQVYNPPTGKGFEFTDVLVDEDDLRIVLDFHTFYEHTPEQLEALERVKSLLD
jgi:hypothetical protein